MTKRVKLELNHIANFDGTFTDIDSYLLYDIDDTIICKLQVWQLRQLYEEIGKILQKRC